jgi:predicted RNA-binding Zn ribbon-like protein
MLPDPGGRTPAPEPLRAVQLFVNTLDPENGIEELADDDALRDALGAPLDLGPGDLARAIEFREALRALLLQNNGVVVEQAALAALARAAQAAKLTLELDDSGRLRLVPRAAGLDGALGRLVAIVHEAALDGTLRRLKACRRDVCHWAFYDRSRNGSSKWCATSVCGNRTNTIAYRRRRASVES